MNVEGFVKWFSGKYEKKIYLESLLLTLIIWFSCLGIATLLWNITQGEQYSIFKYEISDLGHTSNYPGYIAFSIGFIITGIMFIPQVFYFYRCLVPDARIFSKISTIILLLTSLGISLVGVFPSDVIYLAHIIGAVMAFGGFVLASVFLIPPFFKKMIRKAKWPKPMLIIFLFTPPIIVYLFTLITVGIPVIEALSTNSFDKDNLPAIWPFCEWMMFLSALYCLFGMLKTSEIEN